MIRHSRFTSFISSTVLQRTRGLLQRESTEIALLQDPGSPFVDELEPLERVVQLGDSRGRVIRDPPGLVERNRPGVEPPLGGLPGSGVIYQRMPHDSRGETQKVFPVPHVHPR